MIKKIGDYMLLEKIGTGCFGEVYKASKYNSNDLFAIKVINKTGISARVRAYLDREVEILQKFDNDHIISLRDVITSEHNFYLVFDYCNGGDLSKYRDCKGGRVTESVARKILRQVVNGLCSVYSLGGIHRDVKLANILLHYPNKESQTKDEPVAKICDFGFARLIENDTEAPMEMSIVGTPLNMSPEILQRKAYTIKSDIWSLGTITYELLCGHPPFIGKSKSHLDKIVKEGTYSISKELELSTEALDFINACIQYNAKDRLDWQQLALHPFINTDNMTPFKFEKLKEKNKKVLEDKKGYIFTSKVRYNFSDLYLHKDGEESKENGKEEVVKGNEFEVIENKLNPDLSDEYVIL